MSDYLAVTAARELTAAGSEVIAKGFPRREEVTAAITSEGSRAESAAKTYSDGLAIADRSRLTDNEAALIVHQIALGDHGGRLGELEIAAGFAVGDVSDATIANLVSNEASLASAAIVERVRPIITEMGLGVSPEEFGAVGDGVTNDSAAVQAALTAAASGQVLNLLGTYYMGDTTVSAVLAGPIGIHGYGAGTLIWNSGSGIKLTQNSANHTAHVGGLTLLTKAQGAGVAIEIIGTAQNANSTMLQPRTKHRGSITGLNTRGATDTGLNGWAKGIRLLDIMNFMIDQVHVDGYQPTQGNFVSTHGIELVTDPANSKAVDIVVSRTYIYLVQYALDAQGYEGVMLDYCNFIGVDTGFRFDAADDASPLATFTNGQIAFRKKGIELIKSHQGVISNSLIYTHPTSGAPSTATAISLTDVTTTRVSGCTFVSNNGMQTGVSIAGVSKRNYVESCTFYGSITTPVHLGALTTENKVRDLDTASPAQVVINLAGPANWVEGEVLGFYGKTPIAKPQLPATPTAQDIANVLKTLGLVGQA